ncbi:TPA: hypothetical protein QDC22_005660 [Burkholderia stabilis]|nr:hypothetical protein [Burkholderia stabilis]HDR9651768.1 hypothetical protein [Burkholderia stabilis]HDR9659787.1 hypothetical protein [Burkholderia stabilis]HDR9682347.1 hypothetical protein [Burkholderia stabilis]
MRLRKKREPIRPMSLQASWRTGDAHHFSFAAPRRRRRQHERRAAEVARIGRMADSVFFVTDVLPAACAALAHRARSRWRPALETGAVHRRFEMFCICTASGYSAIQRSLERPL